MLNFKVDTFHSGKEDSASDHKTAQERVIEVPVPAQPENGRPIHLENCLETYFDNQVEVYRFAQARRNTLSSIKSGMSDDADKSQTLHIEVASLNDSLPTTPLSPRPHEGISPTILDRPALDRGRQPSIFATTTDPEKRDGMELTSHNQDSTFTRSQTGWNHTKGGQNPCVAIFQPNTYAFPLHP